MHDEIVKQSAGPSHSNMLKFVLTNRIPFSIIYEWTGGTIATHKTCPTEMEVRKLAIFCWHESIVNKNLLHWEKYTKQPPNMPTTADAFDRLASVPVSLLTR